MANDNQKRKKPTCSFSLPPIAISVLDQLHIDSGMNKSEIVSMLIVSYQDSIRKKICV